jgi:glutamyl-tRNA synthetase
MAMPELKERSKTLVELMERAEFIFAGRPIVPDEKAGQLLDDEARANLGALAPHLESLGAWSVEATETAIRDFAEANGLKLGKIAQPLRAALTGRTTSPGIFEVLVILGQSESIARIRDQAA